MKRPHDINQNAHLSILIATGQIAKDEEEQRKPRLHEEPPITGKAKSGVARAAALTPERRTEIARKAAAARWSDS